MRVGYARVSSVDQNLDRQLLALEKENVDKIYAEKKSGKNFDREEWNLMLSELHEGDVLVVLSIDRLGRNYDDIREQWRIITKEIKADIKVIDMPLLDTTNTNDLTGKFISDLVLQILCYVAQVERENIKKRQAQGIAIAKENGAYSACGRKATEISDEAEVYIRDIIDGSRTKKDVASLLGVSRPTLDSMVKRYKDAC